MQDNSRTFGYGLAAFGALLLLVSLWLPWYTFVIPTWAIDQAQQLAGQFGVLGPAIRQGAEIARHLGPLHVTAWQVLNQIDVILAVVAGASGALALGALPGRADGVRPIIIGAGLLALVLAGYRVITPPGPDGFLHAAYGGYVALGAAALITIGATLAGRPERTVPMPAGPWPGPAPIAEAEPASEVLRAWSTTGSVPPPPS